MEEIINNKIEMYDKNKINEYCGIMENDIHLMKSETADNLEKYVSDLIQSNHRNLNQISAIRNFLKAEHNSLLTKSEIINSYIRQIDLIIEGNAFSESTQCHDIND